MLFIWQYINIKQIGFPIILFEKKKEKKLLLSLNDHQTEKTLAQHLSPEKKGQFYSEEDSSDDNTKCKKIDHW